MSVSAGGAVSLKRHTCSSGVIQAGFKIAAILHH
jgi:hypothetical protein